MKYVTHNNNKIIGDNEQLELRSANQSNNNSEIMIEEKQQEEEEDLNTDDDVIGSRYNLRSRRKINYTNIYNDVVDDKITDKNHEL